MIKDGQLYYAEIYIALPEQSFALTTFWRRWWRNRKPFLSDGSGRDDKLKATREQGGEMKDAEHWQQVYLFQWASVMKSKHQGLAFMHASQSGMRCSFSAAKKAKSEGMKKGIPDISLPFPSGQYHGLFIELKADGGKVSPEQMWWIDNLNSVGYRAEICFGWVNAAKVISEYLDFEAEGL